MEEDGVIWKFNKNQKLAFGRSLYVIGSVSQLGCWDLARAVRLKWFENDNWIVDIPLPANAKVQYKYVEASFNNSSEQPVWEPGKNRLLTVPAKTSAFAIMTFNIRYDNPQDGANRWDNRKANVCRFLLEELPEVIGLQQCKPHQREFIDERLRGYYHYIGIPRDLNSDQEVGIFYLSSRFLLLDHGFVWLNEDGTKGKPGFGCALPRNLTYTVLRDCKTHQKILCVNTHLDLSAEAQRQSIPILLRTVTHVFSNWSQAVDPVTGVFLLGDFNCPDSSAIFEPLYSSPFCFKSARHLDAWDDAKVNTFNGFHNHYLGTVVSTVTGLFGFSGIIDHIFVSTSRQAKAFRVIRNHSPHLSDHYPVVVEFS